MTGRPLQETVPLPAMLSNVPPCGQFVGPVSFSLWSGRPFTVTFGLAVAFVPVRPCGQHGSPLLHTPVVVSPILATAGIRTPSPSIVQPDVCCVDIYYAGCTNVDVVAADLDIGVA